MNNDKNTVDENGFPEWTVEEFDAIEEDHIFSSRYRRLIKKAVKNKCRAGARRLSFAASAVAACLAVTVGVYAAVTHGEFFQRAFGNAVFQSVETQEVTLDDGEGGQYTVIYPEKDYHAADPVKAEEMIGEAVFDGPISVDVNDHTIIIESVVRDEQAIVMDFTITCGTGVKAFDLDEKNNQVKGQGWSMESSFFFDVEGALGDIYIDFDRSTETSVHGIYYGLFLTDGPLADGKAPVLSVGYSDGPRFGKPTEGPQSYNYAPLSYKTVEIPATKALERTAFTSQQGGYLDLSPIGLALDMARGLGLSGEEAVDPAYLKTITVEFEDGSVYQVFDREENLENYATLCGGGISYTREILEDGTLGESVVTHRNTGISLIFNHLVDTAEVKSVTVNGILYTAEE